MVARASLTRGLSLFVQARGGALFRTMTYLVGW